jgi:ribosomal protein S18 acetylase RimI-like enzyme
MITVELARPTDNAFVHLLHDEAFGDMTIADYMQWISERGRRVYVIKLGDDRVGFVMIRLGRESVTICKIAVNPHHRRKGCGSEAIKLIAAKYTKDFIRAECQSPSVETQDFFRSTGMKCRTILLRLFVYQCENKERAKR